MSYEFFEKSILKHQNDLSEIIKGNISSWRHSHFIGKLGRDYLMNRTGFPYFSLEQLLFIQAKIEKINFSLVNLNVNQLANCSKKLSYNYLMDVVIPEYLLFVVIDVLGLDIQAADEMFNPKFM